MIGSWLSKKGRIINDDFNALLTCKGRVGVIAHCLTNKWNASGTELLRQTLLDGCESENEGVGDDEVFHLEQNHKRKTRIWLRHQGR